MNRKYYFVLARPILGALKGSHLEMVKGNTELCTVHVWYKYTKADLPELIERAGVQETTIPIAMVGSKLMTIPSNGWFQLDDGISNMDQGIGQLYTKEMMETTFHPYDLKTGETIAF